MIFIRTNTTKRGLKAWNIIINPHYFFFNFKCAQTALSKLLNSSGLCWSDNPISKLQGFIKREVMFVILRSMEEDLVPM